MTAAAQAHALRAAAAFLEHAGLAGLSVTADSDGSLILRVPAGTGTPAARAAAVTAIAAGTLAGHPARVTTHIDDKDQHA